MVWFFRRSAERRQLEIREAETGQGYEIVIRHADGSEDSEQWAEATDLINRQTELALSWRARGWRPYASRDPFLATDL